MWFRFDVLGELRTQIIQGENEEDAYLRAIPRAGGESNIIAFRQCSEKEAMEIKDSWFACYP